MDDFRYKLIVFGVSAFLTGMIGAFYAHYIGVLSPRLLGLDMFLMLLVMQVIGGQGLFPGALMSDAGFLAIDEPSLGLSPLLRREVFKKIRDINKNGTSILLVEQNVIETTGLADRIYLLEDGRIVREGSEEEVFSDDYVREVLLGI